ncbi:MAG: hypothetical protein V3U54_08575 [Thermodesulfobacteriota bacterium]
MTSKLLKQIKAEVVKTKGNDLVLFIIGDTAQNIIPTDEDLAKFGEMVRKVIKEPFPFLVVPPYVKTKILRKVLNGKNKKGKRKTR